MRKKGTTTQLRTFPLPGEEVSRLPRARAAPLKRHIVSSDEHSFVGRIFDLSIVAYHFDSSDELAKHPDCKYAMDINHWVTTLTQRVESLNLVGRLLWPKHLPGNFREFPVSRHEWLTIAADVFLMRYISVVDCALQLVNAVHEIGLPPHRCDMRNLGPKISPALCDLIADMIDDQGALRNERNARVHHGAERGFTDDSLSFCMGSLFEHRQGGVTGTDRFGRVLNIDRMFREALVELQREFNRDTRRMEKQLDKLYASLEVTFEDRFGPRVRAATHGLNAAARRVSVPPSLGES